MASVNFTCGFCGTLVPRTEVTTLGTTVEYRGPGYGSQETIWRSLVCTSCGRFTTSAQTKFEIWYYPSEGIPRVRTKGVPDHVVADYEEALSCHQVQAYKAAVTMTRRAVQAVCLDLGAAPRQSLIEQIDELHGKGEFTNRLQRLAHSVRSFGNTGAHPGDDGLDEVSHDEASQSIAFLEHLLQHVYILGGADGE